MPVVTAPSPGWDSPLEDVCSFVLDRVLADIDTGGAASLAATCQRWREAIYCSEHCWQANVKHRWGAWKAVSEAASPSEVSTWHLTSAVSFEAGDEEWADAPTDSLVEGWMELYHKYSRAVRKAKDKALTRTGLKADQAPCQAATKSNCLWGQPAMRNVEYPAWSHALTVMTTAKMSPQDICGLFLTAPTPLVNLLGVHYLMTRPWLREEDPSSPSCMPAYPDDDVPSILSMLNKAGCVDKRVTIRWWELGYLMYGAGFRTSDTMHSVEGTLGEIVLKPELWRLLLRGTKNEVRRIVVEEDN